ncbi:MAG TPA: phosphotransferase [Trebonia sp.]|jgi:maltokinase|nr:phosphotransferase [Trebonia sp.]
MVFEETLATWLVEQRWFAGKGHGLRDLAIVADTLVVGGDPELRHLIISVSYGTTVDYYQVLVGFRDHVPDRLRHAVIGPDEGGRIAYDALHDGDLTKPLLAGFAGEVAFNGISLHKIPGAEFSAGLGSLVLSVEQSNTSLVYGDESILKVFRRLAPGPNPDLEVTAALAGLGSSHIAQPLGWAQTRLEGVTTVLAILSQYLRLATDGWTLAATSVRDLYALPDTAAGADIRAAAAGGDFAGEARRLGAATAQIHADLAAAFGTDELPTEAIGELTEQMFRKLDLTVSAVPELAKYADTIGEAYSQLARLQGPFPVQRVHGDYHLGQVLRTENGWVVLDFEGEPATPLAQRRARSSPLRDVAGMLRSFDYAARHQLIGHPDEPTLSGKARDWARRNAAAFCAGYKEAGGLDPDANRVLLRALQLDKAVYEVLYEARHRPSWLTIPLESLADF